MFKVDWAWDTGWPDLVFPIAVSAQPLYIKGRVLSLRFAEHLRT